MQGSHNHPHSRSDNIASAGPFSLGLPSSGPGAPGVAGQTAAGPGAAVLGAVCSIFGCLAMAGTYSVTPTLF